VEAVEVVDSDDDVVTMSGPAESSTLNRASRAPSTVPAATAPAATRADHASRAPAPSTLPATLKDYDDSPSTTAIPRQRIDAIALSFDDDAPSFEDETQARPVDDYLLHRTRDAGKAVPLDVAYESLPSLEVRRPFDTYEAEFAERDPRMALKAAVHEARRGAVEADDERDAETRDGSYREPATRDGRGEREPREQVDSHDFFDVTPAGGPDSNPGAPAEEQEFWGRREGSGPRSRPQFEARDAREPRSARDYAAPVPAYDDSESSGPAWNDPEPPRARTMGFSAAAAPNADPVIPPAPRLPTEAAGNGFVMGVQPIRSADASGGHAWNPAAHGSQQPPRFPTPMPGAMAAQSAQAGLASQAPPAHHAAYGQPAHGSAMPPYHAGHAGQAATARPMYPTPMHGAAHPGMHPAMHPATHPAAQGNMHARPYGMHPGATHPPPALATGPHARQPLSQQLTAPSQQARIGRIAWFAAGAAFGLTFAFFATGFFGASKPAETPAAAVATTPGFPPPAPLPPATQAAAGAPTQLAPAASAPLASAAPPPVATVPSAATPPPPAATVASKPAAPPAPAAKAPPAPRPQTRVAAQPPRRPAAPPPGPALAKPIGGADPVEASGSSAPALAPAEAGDLLGAALR